MVSNIGGNGNNIPKNNYGIDQKELQRLKQEAQNANIDFNKDGKVDEQDQKVLQQAIETNSLGTFLDQLGNDIKGVMGLHLTNKVDGAEKLAQAQTIAEINQIVSEMEFEPGTDKARVIEHIKMANIARITGDVQDIDKTLTDVRVNAIKQSVETLFASNGFAQLDRLFGIV